ncbi:MAG: TldD/PmbA family protein [Brevinemataceae bacterium]
MITRSSEYEQLMHHAVSKTVEKIKHGDVFSNISYSQSVSFQNDKLQSIDDTSYSTLACRIFDQGRVGNAFVNDPLKVDEMVKNALESSLFGEEMSFDLPKKHTCQELTWNYSERNLNFTKNELKDMAFDLLCEIKKIAPDAKVSTEVQTLFSGFCLQNTNGFNGTAVESDICLQGGVFEIAEDGSFLEIYEGWSFFDQAVSFEKIISNLSERLENSRKSASLKKSGLMPVIFAPSALDLLLDPIEIAANGKSLVKNLSLFADSEGKKLFSSKFSLTDDPLYQYGSASFSFDDEGTPAQKLEIIKDGVFNSFIFDSASAYKTGKYSTGHASRGSASLPAPAFSNRVVCSGDVSLKEMISSIDYGLLMVLPLGEGQSNVIAGDFSVLTESAFLIEQGVLKGRVRNVMVSGNAFELLKHIVMIENEIHKESSLFAPHIMIDKVSVSVN